MRRKLSSGSGAPHERSRGNRNVVPAVSDHRQLESALASFKSSTEDMDETRRKNYEKAKGTRRGFCLIGVSGMVKKDLKAQSLGN